MIRRAVVLAALVAAALYGLSFVELQVPDMGRALIREAGSRTGLVIDAADYRFSLRGGLELGEVTLRRSLPGVRYRCDAERVRFGYRWLGILRGRLELTSVVLSSPRLAIETGFVDSARGTRSASENADARSAEEPEETRGAVAARLKLAVSSLVLRSASLSIDGAPVVRELDVRLTRPSLRQGALTIFHALSAEGEVAVAEVIFPGASLVDSRARFRAEGGRYVLTEAAWSVGDAEMEGELTLDLNSIPPRYHVDASARHRRLSGVLRVDASGFGIDLSHLSGTGELELPAGRFDDAPIFRALELGGVRHERLVTPLRIGSGVLTLSGDSIAGTVRIDGAVELTVMGRRVSGTWSRPLADDAALSRDPSSRIEEPRSAPREDRTGTAPRSR